VKGNAEGVVKRWAARKIWKNGGIGILARGLKVHTTTHNKFQKVHVTTHKFCLEKVHPTTGSGHAGRPVPKKNRPKAKIEEKK
jgi:hypothetical protein